MPASSKYLNPDVIARLRGLQFRARDVVAGFISGMHRSAYHGFSVEFAEHRQYAPGDDIRYVDWRIFGRADRLQIKQYEEETNLRCNILLDASGSMRYAGQRSEAPSKFEYACGLAATLAYLLVSQQDAVGLMTFDSEVRTRLPSSTGKRHLANLLEILEQTQAGRPTDVKLLFHRLAEELRRRSMVIVISDLLADADDVVAGLEHMARAGHELIVLHVLDDDEWRLPFVENVRFEGLEEDRHLLVDPQSLRESYVRAVQRFSARVRAACLRTRGDYVAVNTADPLEVVLTGYLAQRAGRVVTRRRG
ncbi:MAG: DUF58 domain-containing protein [Planctomycetota bacterium]|nr:MAG: DUF58 domain-containing protein [Planctomycetota bacterium]